jgi:peptidoglycan hydrolase-like protein with peptidoglycan-binding domain
MGMSGLAYAGGVPHGERTAKVQTDNTSASRAGANSGVSRQQTMAMQRALTARNLYQGQVDGVWGPKTESALRNFQTQSGLEATGELNDTTARALGIDAAGSDTSVQRQPVSGKDGASAAATPEPSPAVGTGTATPHAQAQLEDGATNIQLASLTEEQGREMQQRLQLLGYYRGTVDGKLGEGTRAALKAFFQRQAELAQQGVISNAAIGLFGTEPGNVQPVNDKDAHPAR